MQIMCFIDKKKTKEFTTSFKHFLKLNNSYIHIPHLITQLTQSRFQCLPCRINHRDVFFIPPNLETNAVYPSRVNLTTANVGRAI